ncbi:MAG: SRPBCC domain-containing protein [Mangrovibacterium sp.]
MKDFKAYFQLDAEPADVYNALTNPVMIEIWTGEDCVMETTPETEFEMWDGAICGRNIEFEKDKKIVQEWYFGEEEQSIVSIKLHPNKGGTSMEVKQINIPDEAYENIVEGWHEDYYAALNELFEE